MAVSAKELKGRIQLFQRNIIRSSPTAKKEVEEIVGEFKGKRDKDSLWEHWAQLKVLATTVMAAKTPSTTPPKITEESLEAAVIALSDETVKIHLPSLKTDVEIHPASFKRIEIIEEHAWNMVRLEAARVFLVQEESEGRIPMKVRGEICTACNRPLEPHDLHETVDRITEELSFQRNCLYAQIVAPGPAPVKEPVDWADRIIPGEDQLLMEAYHQTNYDVVTRLPQPASRDGLRTLPKSWGFLFSHQAEKEHRKPAELMKDRSLNSVIAVLILEAIREQTAKSEAKADAKRPGKNKKSR